MENGTATKISQRGGKFLTFRLRDEEYAIDILTVREIIGVQPITEIPQAPGFLKGVINLRGRIIPIVDMRTKFGFPEKEHDTETCIIVIVIEKTAAGIIVDAVLEVLDIESDSLDPAPSIGETDSNQFVTGLAKIHDRLIILLDPAKILSPTEKEIVESAAE
ncbi:MAG: chemotaxis protein CheW [bacterium]|nr:chemotaxis protein CheW [bacterium]